VTGQRHGSVLLPPLSPNAWLRWAVVSRLLPPPDRTLRVLEMGCGQGGFGARLAQDYDYLGVEPDGTSAGVAQQRLAAAGGRGEVRRGDLAALGPDETFGLVCAFEVIEHIEDDAAALAGWAARLRPGGTMLLSTPAWQRRFSAADELVGHVRRYDPPVLRARLRAAGLADVDLVHFGMPLGYLLEAGRNAAGRRRLAAGAAAETTAARSDASGRTLQPSTSLAATAARLGTLPFRGVQRAFPRTGPGLVARARKA
jgi:SAM-dependent methyltransferase